MIFQRNLGKKFKKIKSEIHAAKVSFKITKNSTTTKVNNNNYNKKGLESLKMTPILHLIKELPQIVDITFSVIAFRMSVLESTLVAGLPKTIVCAKVESFCSRNI